MKERIYPKTLDINGLSERLENTFRDQGYDVQTLHDKSNDTFVQIKKGGTGHKIVGMDQALTVRIHPNDQVRVSLGQAAWASKTGVEIIGFLVFFPLVITGTYGLYEQGKLPTRVWKVIDEYTKSKNVSLVREEGEAGIQCPNCGVLNSVDAQFCNACGEKLPRAQAPQAPVTF